MPGLRITDIERDTPLLNEFIAEQEAGNDERDRQIDRLTTQGNSTETTVSTTATDNAIPPSVTNPSDSESGRTIDGIVFSEVTFTYNAPNPLKNFQGVFVVVKDYLGSAELVKVYEHTFTGAAGASASFLVTLQRTGETITYFLVAKTSTAVTVEDWATEPTGTAVLDGDVSAPNAPTGAAASISDLGIVITWSENSESNLYGYNLYRHTADVFGSATKIATLPATRSGAPSYFDTTGTQGTTYWFWPLAVNTAGQESTNPTGVNAKVGAVGAHSTYRPTTNPLTATDAGATATISIAAFTMRVAGSDISINSGSITGLSFGTLYYVFYDDSGLAGGSVTFVQTSTKEVAIDGKDRFFVGSITTPVNGGSDTTGNNDGGSGAQSGNKINQQPTTFANTGGAYATPIQAFDGDFTTDAVGNSLASRDTEWNGFSSTRVPGRISAKLKIESEFVDGVGDASSGIVKYSVDGGTGYTNIYTFGTGAGRGRQVDTVTLPADQNLSLVTLRSSFTATTIGDVHRIYEIWIEEEF